MAQGPIRRALSIGTALSLTIGAMTIGAAQAATMKVSAELKASSETPPKDSQGSGLLAGTYDPATKTLTWDVHYAGLTGEATAAHFHGPAPVGKAAGVEIPIPNVASPIKGQAVLTDSQAKDLTDGMMYFNVHTKKNPKGEIRGQVMVEK